jgi:excisionase family DNA binding protein
VVGVKGHSAGDRNVPGFVPGSYPNLAAPMLTVRELARALSVSTATVYTLVQRGELRHVRVLNAIRVPASELAALLERRGVPRGAPELAPTRSPPASARAPRVARGVAASDGDGVDEGPRDPRDVPREPRATA